MDKHIIHFKLIAYYHDLSKVYFSFSMKHPEDPMDIIVEINSIVKNVRPRAERYQLKRETRGSLSERELNKLDRGIASHLFEYTGSNHLDIGYYIS